MTTLTPEDAKAYMIAHDRRVVRLDRLDVSTLNDLYFAALGNTLIHTGPMSHDELVSAVAAIEFPEIRTAREVYVQSVVGG